MTLSVQERDLINRYQRNFPLQPRPYAEMGEAIGLREDQVLQMLADLSDRGILGRVGATVRPNSAGTSTRAALAVPAEHLDAVAEQISAMAAVNHNYAREHEYNLWFVLSAADEVGIDLALQEIASETGLNPLKLPLEAEYHIDLGFPV